MSNYPDLLNSNAQEIFSVPTVGEWAMICLAFIILSIGLIAINDRSNRTMIPVKVRVKK